MRDGGFHHRLALILVPILCLVFLELALRRWAARDVREDIAYQVLFVAGGATWLTFAAWAMPIAGVDLRRDAVERQNPASVIAGCGTMVGVILSFAGANLGEGETIWTTFFPAIIGLLLFFACWIVMGWVCGIPDAVAIDRDVASGVRLAGLLVAMGLILGRASAGNWTSIEATLRDLFHLGWPAPALAGLCAAVHWILRPTLSRPRPPVLSFGLVPAVGFCAVAATWCFHVRGR